MVLNFLGNAGHFRTAAVINHRQFAIGVIIGIIAEKINRLLFRIAYQLHRSAMRRLIQGAAAAGRMDLKNLCARKNGGNLFRPVDALRPQHQMHLVFLRPVAGNHLRGGQRQSVAKGRAIVREPKVFLMDEPLSNLDAKLRVQMRIEISKLH